MEFKTFSVSKLDITKKNVVMKPPRMLIQSRVGNNLS